MHAILKHHYEHFFTMEKKVLTSDLNIKSYCLLSFAEFVHLHCLTAIAPFVFKCRILDYKAVVFSFKKGTVV